MSLDINPWMPGTFIKQYETANKNSRMMKDYRNESSEENMPAEKYRLMDSEI